MASAGLAGMAVRPSRDERPEFMFDIADGLPRKVGAWNLGEAGQAILPPEDDYTVQIYDQIVALRYRAAQEPPVTVVIAYGTAQSYAAQLHRPEWCYPASNFVVTSLSDVDLTVSDLLIPANYMTAKRGERQDAVLFWTRIGNKYPQDIWQQRGDIALSALSRERQDGIVVRLSTPAVTGVSELAQLSDFADRLYNSVSTDYKKLLFG